MKKTLFFAIIIFICDALIFNVGIIARFFIVIIVLKAIFDYKDFKKEYLKYSIYSVTAFLILGANYLNNTIAHDRSTQLISTIERYKQENGAYPQSLGDLTPNYIKTIPRANYTVWGLFWYIPVPETNDAILFYIDLPPFGRPTYLFNKKEWYYNG